MAKRNQRACPAKRRHITRREQGRHGIRAEGQVRSSRKVREFIVCILFFRLAKKIGVSLYEVSAKTGINTEEAFMDLANAMRDRVLVSNMHSDSEDSEQLSSAFHIDGVISDDKLIGGNRLSYYRCCSSAPSPTFV